MERFLGYLIAGLILLLTSAGCARQPNQEINAARTAVDSAFAEGAEKYTPEDAKRLNDELNAAIAEVKAQDKNVFRNYSRAKQMLVSVKKDADAVRAGMPANKEKLREKALVTADHAKSGVAQAEAFFSKAGTSVDTVSGRADTGNELKRLRDSIKELQSLIDDEDYPAAVDRAQEIRAKADNIIEFTNKNTAKAGKGSKNRRKIKRGKTK